MTLRILLVCEGNICRSPLAARLLAARLSGRDVEIVSAGTHAVVGAPMHPLAQAELERRGGTAAGFAARGLTPGKVEAADLVLAMTRSLRTRVLETQPAALRRAFTLLELADLVGRIPPDTPAAELVRWAADHRTLAGPDQDVPDPIGGSAETYHDVADLIEPAVDRIAVGLLHPWLAGNT